MGEIGYGPLERIDGPLPLPPLYGLLSAAEAPGRGVRIITDVDLTGADPDVLSSTDQTMAQAVASLKQQGVLLPNAGQERWLNGVEVYPYPPDPGGVFDACAPSTQTAGSKDFGGELNHPQFAAITVYLAETCTSYKVWDQQAFISRATAALSAIESALVARHLMSGEGSPLNPHLSDANSTCVFPLDDTATSAINALALMEQQIGLSQRQGLVHCSPQFATILRDRFALDNRDGVLRSINGTVIISDFGYSDPTLSTPHGHTGPDSIYDTAEWIYATGPIDIRRSEIFVTPSTVAEALERGTPDSASTGRPNSITYRAERYYLIVWDTEVQAAVQADRCQTSC